LVLPFVDQLSREVRFGTDRRCGATKVPSRRVWGRTLEDRGLLPIPGPNERLPDHPPRALASPLPTTIRNATITPQIHAPLVRISHLLATGTWYLFLPNLLI
jgi:hypothetical protein